MQNFTLIGVTVAEISVTGQIDRITADKTHTNVAFVDKKLSSVHYCIVQNVNKAKAEGRTATGHQWPKRLISL